MFDFWAWARRKRKRHLPVLHIPPKVDAAGFGRLLKLTRQYRWLEKGPDALVELWNLCDTESQRGLIEGLLSRLLFVDSARLDALSDDLARFVLEEWCLPADRTHVSATCDNSQPDGSQALLQTIKSKFAHADEWGEACFYNSMPMSAYAIADKFNVVLLDDFIGTGKTIERKLKWYQDKVKARGVKGVEYFVLSLVSMEAAKPRLDGLDISYGSALWLKKAISDALAGDALAAAKKDMKALEEKLADEWKNRELSLFSFGYGKSEAMFYHEPHNVPSNVFPLFWWPRLKDKNLRRVLLRRLSP